ncbi:MAG: glycosyltransferase [Desulfovibrio sp.]|nr:glycosyltransferase [Desulfovibrio sp.]
MILFFFLLGLFQAAVIWFLGNAGDRLAARATAEREQAQFLPPDGWPICAVIVPVAGVHADTETALRSLAAQNYPGYRLYLVTASLEEPASALILSLQRQYDCIEHVIAGHAEARGQKNHNLLAGVGRAGPGVAAYVFCDSTHIAHADFLRCLLGPIARHEAAFTTGYHEVEPRDQRIVTLAYAQSVMFMHFLQAIPALTQPWGGAMAMSRHAFEHYHVAALWDSNVVDDCSLAGLLAREGNRVRLCAGATLQTWAADHAMPVWRAWLARQILFLKFCMKSEWLCLGFVCALMIIPVIWASLSCLLGILGRAGGVAPFLALCWFCVIGWTIGSWRRFLPRQPAISRWIGAFFCACAVFALGWLGTIGTRSLLWNNILYRVGQGGRVEGMERQ